MAKFKKGASGNPRGKPRTKISQILAHYSGANADILAVALWEFATTGQVTLNGDITLQAENVQDWFTCVRWIYEHIDGKHPIQTDTDIRITITDARESTHDGDSDRAAEALPAAATDRLPSGEV